MSKITLTMALGQIMESAEVRSEQLRDDADGLPEWYGQEQASDDRATADYIDECIGIVRAFVENYSRHIDLDELTTEGEEA